MYRCREIQAAHCIPDSCPTAVLYLSSNIIGIDVLSPSRAGHSSRTAGIV